MTTGYEAKMFGDISRIAKALERIATALETRTGLTGSEPPQARVHKATPREDNEHCATCGARIKAVPGGQGTTWVHADSGAVAAPSP
jgi:hypothetical protein